MIGRDPRDYFEPAPRPRLSDRVARFGWFLIGFAFGFGLAVAVVLATQDV